MPWPVDLRRGPELARRCVSACGESGASGGFSEEASSAHRVRRRRRVIGIRYGYRVEAFPRRYPGQCRERRSREGKGRLRCSPSRDANAASGYLRMARGGLSPARANPLHPARPFRAWAVDAPCASECARRVIRALIRAFPPDRSSRKGLPARVRSVERRLGDQLPIWERVALPLTGRGSLIRARPHEPAIPITDAGLSWSLSRSSQHPWGALAPETPFDREHISKGVPDGPSPSQTLQTASPGTSQRKS